jgi:hypothetical protein
MIDQTRDWSLRDELCAKFCKYVREDTRGKIKSAAQGWQCRAVYLRQEEERTREFASNLQTIVNLERDFEVSSNIQNERQQREFERSSAKQRKHDERMKRKMQTASSAVVCHIVLDAYSVGGRPEDAEIHAGADDVSGASGLNSKSQSEFQSVGDGLLCQQSTSLPFSVASSPSQQIGDASEIMAQPRKFSVAPQAEALGASSLAMFRKDDEAVHRSEIPDWRRFESKIHGEQVRKRKVFEQSLTMEKREWDRAAGHAVMKVDEEGDGDAAAGRRKVERKSFAVDGFDPTATPFLKRRRPSVGLNSRKNSCFLHTGRSAFDIGANLDCFADLFEDNLNSSLPLEAQTTSHLTVAEKEEKLRIAFEGALLLEEHKMRRDFEELLQSLCDREAARLKKH